jgi:uncharacterized protein YheU (UPF0270 family)
MEKRDLSMLSFLLNNGADVGHSDEKKNKKMTTPHHTLTLLFTSLHFSSLHSSINMSKA